MSLDEYELAEIVDIAGHDCSCWWVIAGDVELNYKARMELELVVNECSRCMLGHG